MKQLRDLFRMLCTEYGITIMISSHILSEIESIADTVGVISKGKMMQEISMQEIEERNAAYIELIVKDTKRPAYVLADKLELKNFKVMDGRTIRIYDIRISASEIAKELALNEVELISIGRKSVLCFYEILTRKEFKVDVVIPEEDVYVRGNRESIGRIVNNLLSNAIRYGGDGKYLGFFLEEEKDFIRIDVVDKGKGIEKQFASNVFDRLYTVEDSRNRNIQGNGLGLTIARNLARQMGGDVVLDSQPGIRTVFTVKLRRYAAAALTCRLDCF